MRRGNAFGIILYYISPVQCIHQINFGVLESNYTMEQSCIEVKSDLYSPLVE